MAILEDDGRHAGLGQGRLGVVAITFFVVSAAGPLVAMAGGIPVAMLFGNGAGMPAVFVILTAILLLFSVGYTAMARRFVNAGAFYALVRAGLGARAGGAAGIIALLSYNAMQIALYGLFGTVASMVVAGAGGDTLPWWTFALPTALIIGTLGYRQIDLSVALLGLLCAGEYLVVLYLDGAIIAQGGDSGLSLASFSPHYVLSGSPMIALMLGFSAFIGFEATAIYSEEARDPDRSIPLATYASVLVIGVFYALSTWALVVGLGTAKTAGLLRMASDPSELLFSVAQRFVGMPLVTVMRLLFVTSIFAAMLAFHNAIARYCFALGRDRILFVRFGRCHPRHRSPHLGSLLQTVLALASIGLFAIAGSHPVLTVFAVPTALGTLGVLALMVLTSLSIIRFFVRQGETTPIILVSAIAAVIGLGAVAVMATARFDLMIGESEGWVALLPLAIPLAGLAGIALTVTRSAPDGSPIEGSSLPAPNGS